MSDRLETIVRRVVGDPELAEGIVEEVHARLGRQPPGKVTEPDVWMHTVAMRLALNHIRNRHGMEELDIDENVRELGQERLETALRNLPPDQKLLLDLHYFQGLSARAIADMWQVSEKDVEERATSLLVSVWRDMQKP